MRGNIKLRLCCQLIGDFGVGDAILLGGANSGQTSIKCRDLVCDVEPPPLKNYEDLTMELEIKYLFPTSSSGVEFYIYQLPEGLGMRTILTHGIRMQKKPQTREDIFWIFKNFHAGPKSNLHPRREISSMASMK